MKRGVLFAVAVTLPIAAAFAADTAALRKEAQEALDRGDYAALVRACEPLAELALAEFDAAAADPARLARLIRNGRDPADPFDDCLGLAYAHLLANDWAKAVEAYQLALGALEMARKAKAPLDPRELIEQRTALILLIGRIQREELKDLPAAAATFARGLECTPELSRSLDQLVADRTERMRDHLENLKANATRSGRVPNWDFFGPLHCLRELAVTQEAMGRLAEAIETRSKVHLQFLNTGTYGGISGLYEQFMDLPALGRLLQKLPPGQPLPRTPLLIVLSDEKPERYLVLDDPRSAAESTMPRVWSEGACLPFALAPPPGREIAGIDLGCDMEQIDRDAEPSLTCSAFTREAEPGEVYLGTRGWPEGGPPGRHGVTHGFAIPPGAGLVTFEVRNRKDKVKVRTVDVWVRLRPAQDAVPVATSWIRVSVFPPDGVLTRNEQVIEPTTSFTPVPPGHYTFDYVRRGVDGWFHCEADLAPGRRYALFANLDSPLRWHLTNLHGLSSAPPAARASLARLPDGRWLVAYGASDRKVRLSTSQDLLRWEEPWGIPHDSVFQSVEPTLYADEKGTVWLAYFGNRLWAGSPRVGCGYRPWVTSTRDGRTWSPPRPVFVRRSARGQSPWQDYFTAIGSWPRGAIHLFSGPGGKHWMAWSVFLGSGDSPGEIRELRMPGQSFVPRGGMMNASFTAGPDGRLHMVYDTFSKCIFYRSSADGEHWSDPVAIVTLPEDANVRLWQPQLVLDGPRAAVIYADNRGNWWMSRGTLGPPTVFEPEIWVANWLVPLNGSRAYVADGEVLLLAGKETAWLLRAKLEHLTRVIREF